MGFIHLRNVCQKEVITFRRVWEEHTKDEAQPIIREEKIGETQVMGNTKDSTLEEPLIHLSIWIRNDAIMNEEDNEAEGSRRNLPMKQIKISIQFSCIC